MPINLFNNLKTKQNKMKSKIFLDIDQDNKPVIKIKSFVNSDDLKDKFLNQFIRNNKPIPKSQNSSLNSREREFYREQESAEMIDAIENNKLMIIDAEVLEFNFTDFADGDQSSPDFWSEYTIKPKGYTYLLEATKIVSNKSKEYYDWEKYCNMGSEGSIEKDEKITYNIKLEEVKEYLEKGFKVYFCNDFECKLLSDVNDNSEIYTNGVLFNLEERCTGQSTRLIDEYIQRLFKGEEIIVKDHINNTKSNKKLFDKILKRLNSEHYIAQSESNYETRFTFAVCNPHSLRIKLKKNF